MIPSTQSTNAERDQRLAHLLAELTEQRRLGENPDLEIVARQHPDLAGELRELWGVAQLAGDFASRHTDPQITHDQRHGVASRTPPPFAALPRTFGKYELLEELGRGGMGVVYKARQRDPERIIAIKMLLRGELASVVDLARFRAEAQSAARLEGHPNIVSVHEVSEVDGQPYFSMRYVEGTTLAQLVAKGPLPPRRAAAYLVPACEAVDFAHKQGIYHRDLKPSNVLIDLHGQLHVTDFGLAKRVDRHTQGEAHPTDGTARSTVQSLTQTGAIVGTPSYMPPEQAAGSRGVLCPASDVYSLGAILYELLTGRPPFQAANPVDAIMMVLEQDVVPPRLLNPSVDRELEMICLKCLQKPADLRYQSAAELAADLRAYLQGDPIAARPHSLAGFVGHLFRDTHHAPVLENWGILWMLHSGKILAICAVTQWMAWSGVEGHVPYLALWTVSLFAWGWFFWRLRKQWGPVTFIERQMAHVWAAAVLACISIFLAEWVHGMPALTMAPGLAVIGGIVFLVKAGMLSGWFYFASAAMFATGILMARFPNYQLILFGLVAAACYFIFGLKFYRQRIRSTGVGC